MDKGCTGKECEELKHSKYSQVKNLKTYDKILHISYIIHKFPGQRPWIPDEGDPANFEVIVGNASVWWNIRV